ncbi:MAG: 3-phosphoshikimate 1-carboxyvinyltransferase [Treponema sp.]|jgi:3-phosphoshikimate 1-carboxyvinyltransferase|nr:3-phosphoshikimate 1-carboxyvinyltransferase [Treponema sp.]
MRVLVKPRRFSGLVRIPASKSHTIRQLLIASLAGGVSEIRYPLDSLDARSCAAACRVLGAGVTEHRETDPLCPNPADAKGKKLVRYTIRGNGGFTLFRHSISSRLIDVGNSGTTLYLALAAAALGSVPFEFTGDGQIRRRSAGPLLEALAGLGVRAESANNKGCVPIIIQGPWKGGAVSLPCPTSQYLSALLLAAPLAPVGTITVIKVPLLNEKPYIEMTLSYLQAQGIPFEAAADLSRFVIPGGSSWKPLSRSVPGDFSSAAFPACAAAVSGGPVTILGLDPDDPQGDKFFFDMLAQMGCMVEWKHVETDKAAFPGGSESAWSLTVSRSGPLRGGVFDLNATPDLLPAAAVTAAFARGDTALVNVAHARIKETDRVAVMVRELAKLGVNCTERPDGLVIHGGAGTGISGGAVDGHGDHRIVMAFAAAALGASGPVGITSAESAAVTYPGFLELLVH